MLAWTEVGTSFFSEGQSVSSATASTVLKVVMDDGRWVCASVLLPPIASSTRASPHPPPRSKKAQKADPSVRRARRATFPSFAHR